MTKEQLQQDLKDLQTALKNKTITVNEYCSIYHQTAQQLKNFNQY
jgi:hypothetical protein